MDQLQLPLIRARALPPIRTRRMAPGQAFRTFLVMLVFCSALVIMARGSARAEPGPDPQFRAFVAGLWPEAQRRGISRAIFDRAFDGMVPDEGVIAKTKRQPEFSKPIWEYLSSAVSATRIETGTAKARDFNDVLARIERQYGVDRYVVLGVWGMETNYGGFTGNTPVMRALATLAYARYRGDYFRGEVLMALQILQEGHVRLADFTGSWAGAMGQTQFMPTSFRHYAVDYDGDGHKDIWTNVPDALASTANYLAKHGWVRGYTWGYEVLLPQGFDRAAHASGAYASFAAFARAGVVRADGGPMPTEGQAALLAPAGERGPVFLVTKNFKVIRTYNNSVAYALGVSLLSDRVAGAGPLRTAWPMTEAAR